MARPTAFVEEEVLDKAVNLFWEKGYHDTSAQDIVDCLALSRSSIYNTFSDKRTLFIKALQRYRIRESQGLLNFLKESEPHPLSIQNLLEHVVHTSLHTQTLKGCFIVNTATELGYSDKEIQAIIQANINEVVEAFQSFIEKAQSLGTIKQDKNAKALAIFLFHNITAIRVTSKVTHDTAFFKAHIETIMQTFFN